MKFFLSNFLVFFSTLLLAQDFTEVSEELGLDITFKGGHFILETSVPSEQIWQFGTKGFGQSLLKVVKIDLESSQILDITEEFKSPFQNPDLGGFESYYDINNDNNLDAIGYHNVYLKNQVIFIGDGSGVFNNSNVIFFADSVIRNNGFPFSLRYVLDINFDNNLDFILEDLSYKLQSKIILNHQSYYDTLSAYYYFDIYEYNEFSKISTFWPIEDLNDDGHLDFAVVFKSRNVSQVWITEYFISDIPNKKYRRMGNEIYPYDRSTDSNLYADYNSDGLIDRNRLGVSNSRLYFYKKNYPLTKRNQQIYSEDRNVLFLNDYDTTAAIIKSAFVDLNNDGYLDIIQPYFNRDYMDILIAQPFTRNQMVYYNIRKDLGTIDIEDVGVPSFYDLDFDGDMDFSAPLDFSSSSTRSLKIFRNNLDVHSGDANWIQIWLEGTESPRTPIGAKIILVNNDTSGTVWWKQAKTYNYSFYNSYMQHFGLHFRDQVDSIYVLWPSGNRDTLINVPANQRLVIKEGETYTGIKDYSRLPESFELDQNYPNPFNPETTIRFTLRKPENAELTVYNQLGQQIQVLQSGFLPAGTHQVAFRADQLASGVYLYRLKAGRHVQSRKMVVVK